MRMKGILLVIIAIILGIISYVFLHSNYAWYMMLVFAIAAVILFMGVGMIITGGSPEKIYEATVKDILVTFDSILIKNNEIPKIDGRNVIFVQSIDDLVDAHKKNNRAVAAIYAQYGINLNLSDEEIAIILMRVCTKLAEPKPKKRKKSKGRKATKKTSK